MAIILQLKLADCQICFTVAEKEYVKHGLVHNLGLTCEMFREVSRELKKD